MNIANNLERAVRLFPERPAIVFGDRALTYRDLDRAVNRAGHGLRALEVAPGDRVALFLPNIPEFPVAYLAAQKIGAIAVSVNAMLTTEEVRYVLEDSGARVLFTTAAQWAIVEPLLGVLPGLRHVIVCEGSVPGRTTLEQLGAGQSSALEALDLDRDAPAAILYTSGTTGKQKGATLTHGNVVSNMYSVQHCIRTEPGDRLVLFLPLFHCFGQNFVMNAGLNAGAALILHRRFDATAVLASIEQTGATMFFARAHHLHRPAQRRGPAGAARHPAVLLLRGRDAPHRGGAAMARAVRAAHPRGLRPHRDAPRSRATTTSSSTGRARSAGRSRTSR